MTAPPRRRRLRLVLGPLAGRPKLAGSLAVGLVVGLGLVGLGLRWSTAAIFGWDVTCAGFTGLVIHGMYGKEPKHIQARAAEEDEGQGFILGLVIAAAAASLGAIGAELSLSQAAGALERAGRVAMTVGTVAGSWLMVQLVFTLHYAHAFYAADAKAKSGVAGGLKFPEDDAPDYWDFLHFAVVIGVASQTADIAFTSKTMRRVGTVHSVVAFIFNTVVLALTINMLASLFQSK